MQPIGTFVNKGHTDWHNIKEKESRHSGNTYHQVAVQEGHGIIDRFESASSTIPALTNSILKERNAEYPRIVEALGRVIHLLGKQGLALRGHREGVAAASDDKNQGNFLALVYEIAHYYPLLKKHLEDPKRKDVKYLGPKSQNELINIIGIHMIQKHLVKEIAESGMHSISADEVTSSNDEILSICMRYVNKDREICEAFLQFVDLERITGECIGKALLKFYEDVGVNVKECKGQCYDGASNMQSQKKGAASYISKESPSAIVTHCCSHNLNLTLAASCKSPIIENIMETYKAVTLFFNFSPKREGLLEHIVQKRCTGAEKRKVLIGLCKTRWSERDISYEHFYLAIPFMVEAFEIICGTHPEIDTFDRMFTEGWDPKNKKDAESYLHAVTKFQFIIGLVSLYRLLHPLAGTTQRLQGRSIDVVKAYNEVQSCIDDLKHTRNCINKEFNIIYQQATKLAEFLSVQPSIPRSAARQMHRNNVPAENPEEYYRRVIAIPLIDNFISEMTFRFNKFNTTASKLLLLVPAIVCNPEFDDSLFNTDDLKNQYIDDLPNPDILDQEISLWKRRWKSMEVEDRPNSLAKALKECDDLRFPNIFILLKIGCTLPVTSAECERSFSVMRRMRTWLRSSMTSNRLTALAIMNIHRDIQVDYKNAAKLFFEHHPRKINLANLVFD